MKRLLAVCLLALVIPASAQILKAPPATDLPRRPAAILPGEPHRTPFPNSCNPKALAEMVLELLNQPPTFMTPSACTGPESVCQSQARVESLAQALADEQALLDLKLKIAALANRCS